MSPKKKNRPSKRRALIPFTAGKLPSVSKAMPQAASAIPLVSKEIPLVSGCIPLVSGTLPQTLARKWGLPSNKWGMSSIPATREREPKRPKDIGLFKFLGKVLTAPYQPVEMVKGLTSAIYSQAEEEREPKAALEEKAEVKEKAKEVKKKPKGKKS